MKVRTTLGGALALVCTLTCAGVASAAAPDRTPPTVRFAPSVEYVIGQVISRDPAKVDLRVNWSQADVSGIVSETGSAQSEDPGSEVITTYPGWIGTRTSSVLNDVPIADQVGQVVQPVDGAGNKRVAWGWYDPSQVQQEGDAVYAGTWLNTTGVGFTGQAARYTRVAGSSAKFTFQGNSWGLVTTTGPDRGLIKVIVDGVDKGNVNLQTASPSARFLGAAGTLPDTAVHTVEFQLVSGARFDVDALFSN